MNNIRVNNAQENGLMQIRHSAAWYLYILWIVLPALMWIALLVLTIVFYRVFYIYLPELVVMSGVLVIGILEIVFINKRDYCQLTDKRLIVFVKHCFCHKHLTYRLDQLNDVEIHSLLGVKGITVICHGRSTAYAIKNAVKVAYNAVESGVNKAISSYYGE